MTGYLVAVHDGENLKHWSPLDGRLHLHASDASAVTATTMSVAVRGLQSGSRCKARIAAVNAVGSSVYSAFSEVVLVEESDDMRLWPALRIDLAPEVPSPRTWQSSQYAYVQWPEIEIHRADLLHLIQSRLASLPIGRESASVALQALEMDGISVSSALVSAWLCREARSSPLFVFLNRMLLEDDEDQLASWAPVIQLLISFIAKRAPSHEMTLWRGSRLTRRQVHSLRMGEIIRPPMFLSTCESKDLAEVFQDVYLVQVVIPAQCRYAGMVGKREGRDELVLLPYTPLRVLAIRADDVIEAEVIGDCDAEVSAARAFPI